MKKILNLCFQVGYLILWNIDNSSWHDVYFRMIFQFQVSSPLRVHMSAFGHPSLVKVFAKLFNQHPSLNLILKKWWLHKNTPQSFVKQLRCSGAHCTATQWHSHLLYQNKYSSQPIPNRIHFGMFLGGPLPGCQTLVCTYYLFVWATTSMNYTFYKQLGSGPSPQSCLHFQDFQGSNLLNGCLVLWSNKQILSVFQWFFSIGHWHTVYR